MVRDKIRKLIEEYGYSAVLHAIADEIARENAPKRQRPGAQTSTADDESTGENPSGTDSLSNPTKLSDMPSEARAVLLTLYEKDGRRVREMQLIRRRGIRSSLLNVLERQGYIGVGENPLYSNDGFGGQRLHTGARKERYYYLTEHGHATAKAIYDFVGDTSASDET